MIRWPLASVLVLCTAAGAGCDRDSPPESAPPSGSGETVTGRERIGWIQPSVSASDMMVLQYAAYIDGSRRVLDGFSCSPSSADTFDCTAPLPQLSAGRHTLEIVTFLNSDTGVVESPRSTPLQLIVSGVVSQSELAGSSDSSFEASDGRELRAHVLAADLVDPVDVAVDARGRAFVVERRGTLRIVDADSTATLAAPLEPLFGPRDQGSRALSIALAPDSTRSGLLYILSAEPAANGSRLLVSRFRELHGRLGEAAVVVSHEISGPGVPAEAAGARARARDSGLGLPAEAPGAKVGTPEGTLRFGPDGAMYIAAGGPDGASGKILRFLADGRIPSDNADASPLYESVDLMPAGLDWQPADVSLWTIETGRAVDRLEVRRRSEDPGSRASAARRPGTTTDSPRLPRGTRASGLTMVNAATSPFDGDAIVSSLGLADLLRFDGSRGRAPAGDPVRLLQGRFGAIGGVTATPTGDIYFFTQNNESWGAGRDLLVRLQVVE